jgi:hypothetical protein
MNTTALLVILVVLALAAAYIVFSQPAYPLTQNDAEKYFQEDLASKYPNADVRQIIEIIPLKDSDGSTYYQLKASVTIGLNTSCPELIDVYYDYPPKNFVAQPPEYVTDNCQICINQPICIIAFPEEAIIASHTDPGTNDVSDFLDLNPDATPNVTYENNTMNSSNVWQVVWSSPTSNAQYTVTISGKNQILGVSEGFAQNSTQ